jgi:hypothetical protein
LVKEAKERLATLREYIEEKKGPIVRRRGCLFFVLTFAVLITMVSHLETFDEWFGKSWGGVLLFLSAVLILIFASWILDLLIWSQFLRCPQCGGKLWGCLEPNPKARRVKIRENATGCPGCGLALDEAIGHEENGTTET